MNNDYIPYGKHYISDEDINAVVEVLKSDHLTQGPHIAEFETAFSEYIGCHYAVAVSNGTAALHMCALALDVTPGQKVITTPITFVASANCIRYCGGEVVFADIDPVTFLLDIKAVRKLLEASPKGTYAGIIVVDFAGMPINLEEYKALAEEYNVWIIEDACHAPGGFFIDSSGQVQNCGNSVFADLSVFSFHPVKHIACGEGGMITTNNKELYHKLLRLRSHGIVREDKKFTNSIITASGVSEVIVGQEYPLWYMEMQSLGYNYRLTDFQAALGLSQLKRASVGIERRREIALKYDAAFRNDVYDHVKVKNLCYGHAYHLYVVEVKDRWGLYNHLRANGIIVQIHYIPAHLMPYYKELGWEEGDMPNAEEYYKHCISLPIYPTLTDIEQEFVIEKIKNYYNNDCPHIRI